MSERAPKTIPDPITIKPDGSAMHGKFESPIGTVLIGSMSAEMLKTFQELAQKNGTSVEIEIANFWAGH